jgi:hypothetical protein
MPAITFKTKLYALGSWTVLRLPKDASARLPSRGQVMITGTINGVPIQTPLEPDGDWSHWLKLDDKLLRSIRAKAGDTVAVAVEPTKEWIEPNVPADLKKAVAADPHVYALWQRITPMARWEWVRWTRSTNSTETRKRRVEVACSKLKAGKRRPCCWNRNLCTEPSVSKNGLLFGPEK